MYAYEMVRLERSRKTVVYGALVALKCLWRCGECLYGNMVPYVSTTCVLDVWCGNMWWPALYALDMWLVVVDGTFPESHPCEWYTVFDSFFLVELFLTEYYLLALLLCTPCRFSDSRRISTYEELWSLQVHNPVGSWVDGFGIVVFGGISCIAP